MDLMLDEIVLIQCWKMFEFWTQHCATVPTIYCEPGSSHTLCDVRSVGRSVLELHSQ